MNATPHDPRPRIHVTWPAGRDLLDAMQMAIGELFHVLKEYPADQPLDFDSVRLKLDGDPVAVHVTARVGAPPCPDCHQPGDRPHTDYCPTRCTCPPEALVLGSHQPRCPVRAADPWETGEIKVTGTIPVVPCTDLDCPITNTHRHAGDDVIMNSAHVRGLPLDDWAAKHGNQRNPSIHPDRGPICQHDSGCQHVYAWECDPSCGHDHPDDQHAARWPSGPRLDPTTCNHTVREYDEQGRATCRLCDTPLPNTHPPFTP